MSAASIRRREKIAGQLSKAEQARSAAVAAVAAADEAFRQAVLDDDSADAASVRRQKARQALADREEAVAHLRSSLDQLDAEIAHARAVAENEAAQAAYADVRTARLAAQEKLPAQIEQAIADGLAALDRVRDRVAAFRVLVAAEHDAGQRAQHIAQTVGVDMTPPPVGDPLDGLAAQMGRPGSWVLLGAAQNRRRHAEHFGAALQIAAVDEPPYVPAPNLARAAPGTSGPLPDDVLARPDYPSLTEATAARPA